MSTGLEGSLWDLLEELHLSPTTRLVVLRVSQGDGTSEELRAGSEDSCDSSQAPPGSL